MKRNSTEGPRNESDENQVFCQIYAIFEKKNVHFELHMYFSLFLKCLKIFLNQSR